MQHTPYSPHVSQADHSDRLHVIAFTTRDELTRYFARLDRYLTQRLGADYSRRCPELELWANTDSGPATSLGASGPACGPCLYANEALLSIVRWGRLGRLPEDTIRRDALPKHAWPVLGPSAYPAETTQVTSTTGLQRADDTRRPETSRRPIDNGTRHRLDS
jgi:hypothetical protein